MGEHTWKHGRNMMMCLFRLRSLIGHLGGIAGTTTATDQRARHKHNSKRASEQAKQAKKVKQAGRPASQICIVLPYMIMVVWRCPNQPNSSTGIRNKPTKHNKTNPMITTPNNVQRSALGKKKAPHKLHKRQNKKNLLSKAVGPTCQAKGP